MRNNGRREKKLHTKYDARAASGSLISVDGRAVLGVNIRQNAPRSFHNFTLFSGLARGDGRRTSEVLRKFCNEQLHDHISLDFEVV